MDSKMKRILWHRTLGMSISFAIAATMMPAVPVGASSYPQSVPKLSEQIKNIPDAQRAGSIPASADTVTYEQPFAPFTAGCENFRIPTLLTIQNGEHKGTLVASGDARWEEWNDGGGIDSIASVSDDGGETWSYSFPIYFPDSYGYSEKAATTIIDPGVVEGKDGTLYFIADVNPTGSTTMYKTIGTGSGYVTVNGKRYLALTENYSTSWDTMPTDDNLTDYPYYVDSFNEEGFAQILKREDSSGTGYGVDEWYNLYQYEDGEFKDTLKRSTVVNDASKKIQQNCFYKDSEFHVYSIDYLWVVQSKDGGRTWEHPRDITDQVKRPASTSEGALLVSPGKGIVTKDGDSVIGIYNTLNNESASMLYTRDGVTWKRTEDVQNRKTKTSENEIVELEDGTLRMIYRSNNGKISYADITKNTNEEYEMGSEVITDVNSVSNCNVSVISYSKKIEGKQVLLISCPGSGSGTLTDMSRANGMIFVFLVDGSTPENEMTLYHTFSVPGGETGFVYSCLTELEDGRIGMLWEPNHSTMYFDTYEFEELTGNGVSVELKKGKDPYITICEEETEISGDTDETVASVEQIVMEGAYLRDHVSNTAGSLSSFSSQFNLDISLSDAEITFQKTDTANVWKLFNEFTKMYYTNEKDAGMMFKEEEHTVTVTPDEQNDGIKAFRIKDGSRPLFFHAQNMDFNAQGSDPADAASAKLTLWEKQDQESPNDAIPGYIRATEIKDGGKYIISYIWTDGSIFILYPKNGSTADHTKLLMANPYVVKITGVGEGVTKAVIDGKIYKISVEDTVTDVDVTLKKGDTYFIPTADVPEEPPLTGDSVTVQKIDRIKEGLFDHIADEPFSTDSYDEEAHEGLSLTDAEFTFSATDTTDAWTVSHGNLYLSNPERVHSFFSETPAKVKAEQADAGRFYLSRAEANKATGGDSIVSRYGQPIGNLVFYYREMNFRSYGTNVKKGNVFSAHGGNLYGTHADYAITLLEKQDGVSEGDLLPGYKAAEKITDGKQYLIAYIWNDSVFVLYPENGLENSTKLVNPKERGLMITAESRGSADVTADNIVYHITVTDEKLTQTENELKTLLAQVEQAYKNQSAGMASWQEFQAAYEEAKKLLNQPGQVTVQELEELAGKLDAAYKKLEEEQKKSEPGPNPGTVLQKGYTETIGNVLYEVTDLTAKTVSVAGGTDTELKIMASVRIQNEMFKVTAIKENAFKGSKTLKKVTIGSNVTMIGNQAFAGCSKLKTVTIGKNVKTIGKRAFYNSKNLTKVIVKGKSKLNKVQSGAFKKTSSKISIQLPKALKKKSKLVRQIRNAGIKKGLK